MPCPMHNSLFTGLVYVRKVPERITLQIRIEYTCFKVLVRRLREGHLLRITRVIVEDFVSMFLLILEHDVDVPSQKEFSK